jgi:mono/diheme cytochrome c family protein
MVENTPLTPVEEECRRIRRRRWGIFLFAAALVGSYFFWRIVPEVPVAYADGRENFKYGSFGSEPQNGIPYWIWKVLPTTFPEHVPKTYNDALDYTAFGFLQEEGHDTPIGFSQRRVYGITLVGLNCAVCHTGSVRTGPGAEPRLVLGMPANTMDLQSYFRFLFDCAGDGRFTETELMPRIEAVAGLDPLERLTYKIAIKQVRDALLARSQRLSYLQARDDGGELIRPPFGPGRVDTFNPYKAVQFNFPMADDHTVGTADLPSLWNQQIRKDLALHWDGNNSSLAERNKSAAMGAGATPVSLDLPRMDRFEAWIETLPPPKYADFFGDGAIDPEAAGRGARVYRRWCARCHDVDYQPSQDRLVGTVIPIEDIRTDRQRLDSFSPELESQMNTIGAGHPWRFNHFRKTFGYACMPLDGVWARAPYLHNGSVPTLWELLTPEARRSQSVFYRGDDVYDTRDVGFRCNVARDGGRRFFPFDPTKRGNGNQGHSGPAYGTDLPDGEKKDLLEYLKTL